MTTAVEFSPDWKLPSPSRTISYLLAKKSMSIAEFDEAAELKAVSLGDVIDGYRAIDHSMAIALEKCLGGSCNFWITRERQYRASLAPTAERSFIDYLKHILPIRDMLAYGWLDSFNQGDSWIDAAIRFFGVNSKEEFKERYEDIAAGINFRRSGSFDLKIGSLAAWMRAAEIQASLVECRNWSKETLRESITQIKPLTRDRDPAEFLPVLKAICSNAGVALVIVRAPSGCPVSGATRFLSPKKALIALTFRHLTDDHFWFSFFHEIGHLVLHDKSETFIECQDMAQDSPETEANTFASSIIVPTEYQSDFEKLSANKYQIVRFARASGVSPGLIVGQMQHRKMLRHNQMNKLKRRFTWPD